MTTSHITGFALANASWVTDRLIVGGDLDVHDDHRAAHQLLELVNAGLTHIVDVRLECNDEEWVTELDRGMTYLWHGMDDAGQRVPGAWFDVTVDWVLEALEDPYAVVLTHCHMGINRGPSLGFAVLLALGWDCVEALAAIRQARPIAHVAYAEDALRWHHERTGAAPDARRSDRSRLRQWRAANPMDLVRIIADQRARAL